MNGPPCPSGRFRTGAEAKLGNWSALAAFLTPAFIWVEFTLIGRIFLPELILFALLPFLLMKHGRLLAAPLPRTFLILAVFWLMAQVLTDVIRESDLRDYSRGWSKIVFMTLNFCALYLLLYGSRRRLVLFALGVVAGGYLSFLLNPSAFAENYPWKFGLGPPTILAAVLIAQWRPIYQVLILPSLPILMVGIYSMAVGSRTYAGVSFLVTLYVLAQQIAIRRRRPPADVSLVRTAVFLVIGVITAGSILELYEYMAVHGYLTEQARQTYESQAVGSFGVLLGGRPATFVSIQAVMDSPLIGHGSWAKNPDYVSYILDLRHLGYDVHPLSRLGRDLIPTHSHLMSGWVESGIMGAIFWLWVLALILRVLANQYRVREPLGPLIAFIGFLTLWDIFFSPFGAAHRYLVPFKIVLMMFAWDVLRARIHGNRSGRTPLMSSYRTGRAPGGAPVPRSARRIDPKLPAESAPPSHRAVSEWRPLG